jgi:hypothetical protein
MSYLLSGYIWHHLCRKELCAYCTQLAILYLRVVHILDSVCNSNASNSMEVGSSLGGAAPSKTPGLAALFDKDAAEAAKDVGNKAFKGVMHLDNFVEVVCQC